MAIYLNPKDRLREYSKATAPTGAVADAEEKYTVKELREMCKEKGLVGYSRLKEAELIELLGL